MFGHIFDSRLTLGNVSPTCAFTRGRAPAAQPQVP